MKTENDMYNTDLTLTDESIIENTTALIERADGSRTCGISLTVVGKDASGKPVAATEILLDKEELRAAIQLLDEEHPEIK